MNRAATGERQQGELCLRSEGVSMDTNFGGVCCFEVGIAESERGDVNDEDFFVGREDFTVVGGSSLLVSSKLELATPPRFYIRRPKTSS